MTIFRFSILLAILAVGTTSGRKIDTSLDRNVPQAPADPLEGAAGQVVPAAPAAAPAPSAPANDPLGNAAR